MTTMNGNGAASNGALPDARVAPPKLDTAAMTEFWMSSSARLMRSSEILMRGMTAVARLEVELGQQFLQRGMAGLHAPGLGTKPDELMRTQMDEAKLNVESLMSTMLKIAEEVRQAMTESTKALFDTAKSAAGQDLVVANRDDATSVPATARGRNAALSASA